MTARRPPPSQRMVAAVAVAVLLAGVVAVPATSQLGRRDDALTPLVPAARGVAAAAMAGSRPGAAAVGPDAPLDTAASSAAADPSAPPVVRLVAPDGSPPVLAASGVPLAVRFTVDQEVDYAVGYRGGPLLRRARNATFPGGTGRAGPGEVVVAVPTPADLGAYGLSVAATNGAGQTATVAVPFALLVLGTALTEDQRCDPTDRAHCLLPFPNDRFTAADPDNDTGRRVDLDLLSMPRNVLGKPIDPTEWNRNDGFSPGAMVMARVPGLDLHQTWGSPLDHVQDLSWYRRDDAPIVLLDTSTGQRHPFWSELDSHPDTPDGKRLLILRPAANLRDGTRYVVALRNLRGGDGSLLAAGDTFARYRDGRVPPTSDALADGPRAHLERVFADLAAAGVDRSSLYLAWDFTVASERNLTERALSIRDKAFAELGDTNLADSVAAGQPPEFAVTSATDVATGATMRRVEGTVSVPNFLTPQVFTELSIPPEVVDATSDLRAALPDPLGDLIDEKLPLSVPGSRFSRFATVDGLPTRNPLQASVDVPFTCDIARGSDVEPSHPLLYGHGLLGSRDETSGSSTEDLRLRGFTSCAVDWWGMSFADLLNVATILLDVSAFASLADRVQQGFLNFLFLGRLLLHPDGLSADPAFRGADGTPLVRSGELFYDGNSQGGIMGGSLTALAPDFNRAKLGVPGMNYSTLLNRSVDWEGAYGEVLYTTYPDPVDRQFVFTLIQMLWDRAEGNGYANHMTSDPLPNTPPHQVMLQVAFADHQVADVAAEVEGRTIGARLHTPSLPDGLHWSVDPSFGFEGWDGAAPLEGESVLVYWYSADRGNTTPPNGNLPSTSGEDPHGDPRKDNRASDQVAHFLLTGEVVDVCGGPCVTTDATRRN